MQKGKHNKLFLFQYIAERQEKQPSEIKTNAVPINITWLYLAQQCTMQEKPQRESQGLKERTKTVQRRKKKSILELVINKDNNKYPKVNVRPFKQFLNASDNGYAHYQQKSPEHTGKILLSKQTKKQTKKEFLAVSSA